MGFRSGDRVNQQTYGVGEITEISSDYVSIAFDDGSVRKFVSSMVQMEPSSVSRPPRSQPAGRARKARGAAAAVKDAASKTA